MSQIQQTKWGQVSQFVQSFVLKYRSCVPWNSILGILKFSICSFLIQYSKTFVVGTSVLIYSLTHIKKDYSSLQSWPPSFMHNISITASFSVRRAVHKEPTNVSFNPLERRWESLCSTGNSLTDIAWPSNELFEEGGNSLDSTKACFKRLLKELRESMSFGFASMFKSHYVCQPTWRIIQTPAQIPATGQAMNQRRRHQMMEKRRFLISILKRFDLIVIKIFCRKNRFLGAYNWEIWIMLYIPCDFFRVDKKICWRRHWRWPALQAHEPKCHMRHPAGPLVWQTHGRWLKRRFLDQKFQ